MTVQELHELTFKASKIKVLSGYNGDVVCEDYKERLHKDTVGVREVVRMWPMIEPPRDLISLNCNLGLYCYVHGDVEYEKENRQ